MSTKVILVAHDAGFAQPSPTNQLFNLVFNIFSQQRIVDNSKCNNVSQAVFSRDLQVKSGELSLEFTHSLPSTRAQHSGRFSAQTHSQQQQILLRMIRPFFLHRSCAWRPHAVSSSSKYKPLGIYIQNTMMGIQPTTGFKPDLSPRLIASWSKTLSVVVGGGKETWGRRKWFSTLSRARYGRDSLAFCSTSWE